MSAGARTKMSLIVANLKEASLISYPDCYAEGDQAIFGGREVDVKNIESQILNTMIFVLHGESGVGKTSTLMAGIFPAMRERGWIPISVNEYTNPVLNALTAIKKADTRGINRQHNGDTINALLTQSIDFIKTRKVLLCFDQFEQFFIKNKKASKEAIKFQQLIHKIIKIGGGQVKLIFSISDDYLSKLSDLELFKSSINNKYALKSLDKSAATMAIIKPLHNVSVDNALLDAALEDLSHYDYEPLLLKTLFNALILEATKRNQPAINLTIEDYRSIGEFRGFIYSRLDAIIDDHKDVVPSVIYGILASRVGEYDKAYELPDVKLTRTSKKQLTSGLKILIRAAIIRCHNVIDQSTKSNSIKYRLIHPNLSSVIAEWLYYSTETQVFNSIKSFIAISASTDVWHQNPSVYLSFDQLEILDKSYLQRFQLGENELSYVFESAVYRKSPIVKHLYDVCGMRSTIMHLAHSLKSRNEQLRVGAAYTIGELAKYRSPLKSMANPLLELALTEGNYKARMQYSYALAHVCSDSHLEKVRLEIKNITFGVIPIVRILLLFVLNSFQAEAKDFYLGKTRWERALDVLVAFQMEGKSLSKCRWLIRRKVLSIWMRRQIHEKKRELHHWIYQGRNIGVSSTLQWLFSIGTLVLLTISNVYFLEKYKSLFLSIGYATGLFALLIVTGILFGRSMSKTAFIKFEIKKYRGWYLYIFTNPFYRYLLFIFVFGSLALVKQFNTTMVFYYIFGPLFLWLMIPFTIHLLNRIDYQYLQHRYTIQGKSFIGSAFLLLTSIGIGLALYYYYHEIDLYVFFLIIGTLSSALFMMIYSSITFLVDKHMQINAPFLLHEIIVSKVFNIGMIVMSNVLIGYVFVSLYGAEAITGHWLARTLSFNTSTDTFFVTDVYQRGPEDTNYYQFSLEGKSPYILTIPESEIQSLTKQPNTRLLIDGQKAIDLKYSVGDSFIIPAGNHFVVSKLKNNYLQDIEQTISFEFGISRITSSTVENGEYAYFQPLSLQRGYSKDVEARIVVWKKEERLGYWYAQLAVTPNNSARDVHMRILKDLYSDQVEQSINAVISSVFPMAGKIPIDVSIIKHESLKHVPTELFYYENSDNISLIKESGNWTLNLYLSSDDIDPNLDSFTTILFIALSEKM